MKLTNLKTNRKSLRQTALCLMVASTIALPGVSQAGWFGSKQPVKKVVNRVAATRGNIQARMADVSRKLNEIYSQIEQNRPIMQQMKNGPVINGVKAALSLSL